MSPDINNPDQLPPVDQELQDMPTSRKSNFLNRYFLRLRTDRGAQYFAIAVVFILLVGICLLAWMSTQPKADPTTYVVPAAKKKVAAKIYSPLTGLQVTDEAATKRQVTAIMIENSTDARPQSGLKDAGVVFEAIAEGGITRFISLYQETRPGLIGPVRSVRPYYVEWAAGFDPAVAHIGGSARALEMIRSGNYGVDLDQFFNAPTYWRASDRDAPHNVYTSFDKLDALTSAKGKTTSNFSFSPRVDDKKAAQPNATHIDVPMSYGSYNISYDYDGASNSYVRKQAGENHIDREGGQIQPKVAIVMSVVMSREMEDGLREQIATTGTGKAYIFQNGTLTEGVWSKPDAKSKLEFKDASGKEIPLVRGQTWISALDSSRAPTWQ